MPIWDKLRTELDRAGRVAQGALDEGKLRLEVFRARQLVDRAAQALGYAVFRSRTTSETLDEPTLVRLTDAMREREVELAALEERMRAVTGRDAPLRDHAPTDRPLDPPVAPSADMTPRAARNAAEAGGEDSASSRPTGAPHDTPPAGDDVRAAPA